ncbi:MAG: hypothetical protein AB7I27_01735 [Bacteriovoracaceae bacterium]
MERLNKPIKGLHELLQIFNLALAFVLLLALIFGPKSGELSSLTLILCSVLSLLAATTRFKQLTYFINFLIGLLLIFGPIKSF